MYNIGDKEDYGDGDIYDVEVKLDGDCVVISKLTLCVEGDQDGSYMDHKIEDVLWLSCEIGDTDLMIKDYIRDNADEIDELTNFETTNENYDQIFKHLQTIAAGGVQC